MVAFIDIGRRVAALVVSACLVATPISQSYALNLKLGVAASLDATFGLDKPTRDLIASLPKEVHDQIIKTLQDALPLLDQSVSTYVAQVDDLLDRQINHMECALKGTIAGIDLKSMVFSGEPTPVQKLDTEINSVASKIGFKDSTHDTALKYADLLYDAVLTGCEVQIAAGTAQTVEALTTEVRVRWAIWNRLDGQCPSAGPCFDMLLAMVNTDLTSENAADLTSANAPGRFKAISKPKAPGFFGTYDTTQYETVMAELAAIHDSIMIAKAYRTALESKGSALLGDAMNLLTNAETNLKGVPSAFPLSPNCSAPAGAKAAVTAAFATNSAISDDLQGASLVFPALAPNVAVQNGRFGNLNAIGNKILAGVHAATFVVIVFHGGFPPIPVQATRSCGL